MNSIRQQIPANTRETKPNTKGNTLKKGQPQQTTSTNWQNLIITIILIVSTNGLTIDITNNITTSINITNNITTSIN